MEENWHKYVCFWCYRMILEVATKCCKIKELELLLFFMIVFLSHLTLWSLNSFIPWFVFFLFPMIFLRSSLLEKQSQVLIFLPLSSWMLSGWIFPSWIFPQKLSTFRSMLGELKLIRKFHLCVQMLQIFVVWSLVSNSHRSLWNVGQFLLPSFLVQRQIWVFPRWDNKNISCCRIQIPSCYHWHENLCSG